MLLDVAPIGAEAEFGDNRDGEFGDVLHLMLDQCAQLVGLSVMRDGRLLEFVAGIGRVVAALVEKRGERQVAGSCDAFAKKLIRLAVDPDAL
jgi:hypothetical protein